MQVRLKIIFVVLCTFVIISGHIRHAEFDYDN